MIKKCCIVIKYFTPDKDGYISAVNNCMIRCGGIGILKLFIIVNYIHSHSSSI